MITHQMDEFAENIVMDHILLEQHENILYIISWKKCIFYVMCQCLGDK